MTPERFRERLKKFESFTIPEPISGCILWTGAKSLGYGSFYFDSRNRFAHQLAWRFVYGYFPKLLDHKCRVRSCVNVHHLEEVTNAENVLRGKGPTANNARKTHCNFGHPFTKENVYYFGPNKRWRHCKLCLKRRKRHGS